MRADRKWVERNLGYDPIAEPPPEATFAFPQAARKGAAPEDFQREIIDFDSESPAGLQFLAFTTATGLSRYKDVPWPKGLAPKTGPAPTGAHDGPLPRADVLVVTWTVDEGHALSRVLTPGKDSHNDYFSYTHNFAALSQKMRKGCPALELKRLGAWWTTTIGKQSVVVFKSDSHMSQDGPDLPNIDVWTQIIEEVQPKLVITTGTAGGIGKDCEVGDVVVSPIVRFDCTSKFKKEPFAKANFNSVKANAAHFRTAKSLFKVNAAQLPKDNTRLPKIIQVSTTALEFVGRHDGLLRLRHLRQPLQASGARRCLRDGRRGARTGRVENGRQGAALARHPQRVRPADQGRRHPQAAGRARRPDLQGFWPMEHGVQRHHLLGQHCGGVGSFGCVTGQI